MGLIETKRTTQCDKTRQEITSDNWCQELWNSRLRSKQGTMTRILVARACDIERGLSCHSVKLSVDPRPNPPLRIFGFVAVSCHSEQNFPTSILSRPWLRKSNCLASDLDCWGHGNKADSLVAITKSDWWPWTWKGEVLGSFSESLDHQKWWCQAFFLSSFACLKDQSDLHSDRPTEHRPPLPDLLCSLSTGCAPQLWWIFQVPARLGIQVQKTATKKRTPWGKASILQCCGNNIPWEKVIPTGQLAIGFFSPGRTYRFDNSIEGVFQCLVHVVKNQLRFTRLLKWRTEQLSTFSSKREV